MGKFIDVTGMKFGRLEALKRVENTSSKATMWLCKCECGQEVRVRAQDLKNGHTQSCGCLQRELIAQKMTTHGKSKTRLHTIWLGMMNRCYHSSAVSEYVWDKYGGVGIRVAQEWHDFQVFYEWAVQNGYKDGLTVDRVDGTKDYAPENCRWATRKQQSENRSSVHRIAYEGRYISASDAAEIVGVNKTTVARWCREGKVKSMEDIFFLKERMKGRSKDA